MEIGFRIPIVCRKFLNCNWKWLRPYWPNMLQLAVPVDTKWCFNFITTILSLFVRFILQLSGLCPQNWIQLQGSCYKVSSESLSWNAAKSACEAMRSTLALVKSPAEQQAVASIISQKIWIGLQRDSKDNSSWLWVDGSHAKYFNWAIGQPSNTGRKEFCVHIFPKGKWNDKKCTAVHHYLCETNGRWHNSRLLCTV